MKKYLGIGFCMAAALILSGCSNMEEGISSVMPGKELVVGVRKNLSRISYYYEDTEQYLGFEDDLAALLADKLGYSGVQFVGLDAGEREDALSSGQVDCLVASFSKTKEREEQFDLSEAYYKDYGRILIEKSTLFKSWSDLSGKKVGYLRTGHAKEAFLDTLGTDSYLGDDEKASTFCITVPKDNYEELETALEQGTLDAACMDGSIALGFMDDEMEFLSDFTYSEEDYCVATVKGSDLSEKIDEAVAELIADGTINKLENKWDIYSSVKEDDDESQ